LFVQAKPTFVEDDFAFQLIWFNENLDTLLSRFVFSPYLDSAWTSSSFLMPTFTIIQKDSCVFMSAGIFNSTDTGNDFCIKKFSPSAHELWTYIYATEASQDLCYAMLPREDGGVIAAILQSSYEDSPTQDKLLNIDRNGNETWQWINPGGYSIKLINCMIGDVDDLIISGRHVIPNSPINGTIAIVLKMDTLGNTHWARTFGEYEEFRRKDFTNVVQTCDGNYVAGGTWVSTPGSEEIPEGQSDQDVDEFAYILKLDRETGEIIWERKYRFLEIYGDQHTLIDMKATLDGGVIFCGEARDSYQILEGPIQQGWLVKLDECGCLVPGCDTLCSYVGCASDKPFFPVVPSHFIVGPNPASQFINIYFAGGDLDLTQTHFDMYDIQGRLVYSFAPDAADTTYMLSTEKFAGGTYVLLLHHNGEKVQDMKLVVTKD
jgi:Secretion system C-terminal sorting domain